MKIAARVIPWLVLVLNQASPDYGNNNVIIAGANGVALPLSGSITRTKAKSRT